MYLIRHAIDTDHAESTFLLKPTVCRFSSECDLVLNRAQSVDDIVRRGWTKLEPSTTRT